MRLLTSIIILLAIATFPGCYPDPEFDSMPERTTAGLDRIGFVVNGKPGFNTFRKDVEAYFHGDTLTISGFTNTGDGVSMSLLITDTFTNHPEINENDSINWAVHVSQCTNYVGAGHPGNVCNINFSRFDAKVVSGTFSIKTSFNGGPDCVQVITDGRFDINVSEQKLSF